MYTINEKDFQVPINVYLDGPDKLEDSCLVQAENLAKLPFLHKWVCLMPDTHAGYGMPIGGVIATKDVIIPNAVGVDIGCGMNFCSTNIKVADIKDIMTGNGIMIKSIVGDVMRAVPTGIKKFNKPQESKVIDKAKEELYLYKQDEDLLPLLDGAYYQIGTLGGGNHFVELQDDQDGYLCIMIHSGSRNMGAEVCRYFRNIAIENREKYNTVIPLDAQLDFLPTDTDEGKQYLNWMYLAVDYAAENRDKMMEATKNAVKTKIEKFTDFEVEFADDINCTHNYASKELHYGEDVWVHRKGAIRIKNGELAVIPGAMGSYSYVVEGKGCPETFNTSSHGAGRVYSRTDAKEKFTVQDVVEDLKAQDVILGKAKKSDIAEEL